MEKEIKAAAGGAVFIRRIYDVPRRFERGSNFLYVISPGRFERKLLSSGPDTSTTRSHVRKWL
jgi:hypothetical protein